MTEQAPLLPIKVDGTPGKDIDPPRDVQRLVLEVATDSMNGTGIEGHYLPAPAVVDCQRVHKTVRIEVYADRLNAVLARVRGPKDHEALRLAKEMAPSVRQRWLDDEISPSRQAKLRNEPSTQGFADALEQHMHWKCPVNEWTLLHEVFPEHRHRLPPLLFCRVVDRDGVACDMGEFDRRPQDFLHAAPPTTENRTRLAADHQAKVIAEAMQQVVSGGSNAELVALRAKNAELEAKLDAILKKLDRRDDNKR